MLSTILNTDWLSRNTSPGSAFTRTKSPAAMTHNPMRPPTKRPPPKLPLVDLFWFYSTNCLNKLITNSTYVLIPIIHLLVFFFNCMMKHDFLYIIMLLKCNRNININKGYVSI